MSTDESSKKQSILVGEVLKAFGLRGEVAVKTFTENPNRFRKGSTLMIGSEPERTKQTRVESVRRDERFDDRLIVVFQGVTDRNEAEKIHGHLLFVEPQDLPVADEDAYWEHQIVGAEVFDPDGVKRGVISAIHAREGQDLWEIQTDSGTLLFPAAKDLILSVDADEGKVVIDPPEGLFDEV